MSIEWNCIIIETLVNFSKGQAINIVETFKVFSFCKIIAWGVEMMKTGLSYISMICIFIVGRVFEQFLIITTLMIVGTLLYYLFKFINWFCLAPLYYCYYFELSGVSEFVIVKFVMTIIISLNVIIINIDGTYVY